MISLINVAAVDFIDEKFKNIGPMTDYSACLILSKIKIEYYPNIVYDLILFYEYTNDSIIEPLNSIAISRY